MGNRISKLRILIVDDSFEDREILKRYLKGVSEYDCTIFEAKNVEEAIFMIDREMPELAFIDFNMPGQNGLDLLERLCHLDKFDFPIIMLTGQGSENVAVKAMKIGVGDYLVKDEITPQDIRRSLISTLDRFRMVKSIEAQRRQLEVAARTDGLTGLWNRRYFDEQLEIEIERASRYNLTLSLAMADLDHFKNVNDSYGHVVGDTVLIGFSKVLKQSLRMSDFAARYGGEEFCILMPNIELFNAQKAVFRLVEQLKMQPFRDDQGEEFFVTASYGIVQFKKDYATGEDFLEMADKALYHAKENGRNKVVLLHRDGNLEIVE